jgi:hypothetical protein
MSQLLIVIKKAIRLGQMAFLLIAFASDFSMLT